MGTYKCTDPGPVLYNMAVGRIAVLYYRQIRIAYARTYIAKLANWRLQISCYSPCYIVYTVRT